MPHMGHSQAWVGICVALGLVSCRVPATIEPVQVTPAASASRGQTDDRRLDGCRPNVQFVQVSAHIRAHPRRHSSSPSQSPSPPSEIGIPR